MSNNSELCIEQSIQQAIDECSGSIQAAFADFTNWVKSERRQSTPPLPPLNHEDPFSPSSDECASIGSPLVLGNEGYSIVRIDDVMFDQANNISQQHSTNTHNSQDLYKTKNKGNNDNRRLFPAFSNSSTNGFWTSHCDTSVRSYKLPEITFTGCIYKSTLQMTQLSVPEIVTEGLLVKKFLDDFEFHIKQSNLNIENHWYGLMEICFKSVRDKHIELYMWFKKRLYEGLPWSSTQAIMKHQLGFESCTSKKTINEALARYRQGPRESFERFYDRFQPYVAACKALSLHSDHVLIHQFISNIHADVYKYMEECLYRQLSLKTKNKTLPFPEEVYNSLFLGGDVLQVLSKIPSSWEEFSSAIVSVNLRKLCTISNDAIKRTTKQIKPRRINREKLHERKAQRYFGGDTRKKTVKFA
ncbi:hypothetical protein INT48_003425 [Thamnidium elegans]|uniref:Uncharacterized protein n=1 Tax=Thamnidium elegans TaxID=101142 RepID=A0A8H7SST4_9FUNG|nr:hypothetical protein INT48_003425 [Thamnidium elegans]